MRRCRPLSGFWRRLAIGLWKCQQKREKGTRAEEGEKQFQQEQGQDKASLLLGFNALRQELGANKKKGREYEEVEEEQQEGNDDGEADEQQQVVAPLKVNFWLHMFNDVNNFQVNPSFHEWLHLLPDYRPNSYSKPVDQFPAELQKHVDDSSAQGLLEQSKQWRQHRLTDYFKQTDRGRQCAYDDGILLSGNGLPLNPKGRTGLAGRGDYANFGPNRLLLYALFRRQSKESSNTKVH